MNKNLWLLSLLLAPLLAAQMLHQFTFMAMVMHVVISTSLVLLLKAAEKYHGWMRSALKSLWIAFYFVFLFLLLFEVILFDFTGRGFTNEVYFHFELESIRIAFNEYPFHILVFAFLVVLYVFLLNLLLKNNAKQKHLTISFIALLLLVTMTMNSSMARFSYGFINYIWENPVELDRQLINQYVSLGVLSNASITTRKQLKAEIQPDTRNLILLYLESFNEGLLNLEQYPGLTPHLNRLNQTYRKLDHLSSSYVTIEGIISSQCGTMLPMTAGNNTFLNSGQLMSNMPCLGDVLKKAGYTQYYLGGAAMEFAGKGRFFEEHGYDHIWGSEYWYANGFKKPAGVWGLSDAQLFENALSTIKQAAENPPYNVTLLTLGTHLPGYSYEGCNPYLDSDEPFINAIHCTDQLVGQFVDELEASQLLDDAVLMIVADHGVFPTPKMKELFSDVVDDRRLIGITNYKQDLSHTRLSSYDLAPTLLDMLNIKHNARFLFGQSLLNKVDYSQKFVTRYLDWQDSKLVNNNLGECTENLELTWPLNSCYKYRLLGLTSQLLEFYSVKEPPEALSCKVNLLFNNELQDDGKNKWALWLNQDNHFDHFYQSGRLLNSHHINSGVFVFVLNDELAIEKHMFYKHDVKSEIHVQAMIENTQTPLLVIKTQAKKDPSNPDADKISVQITFYKNNNLVWTKNTLAHVLTGVDLCQ
ncbi:hypothetical protein MNBD_GAMMA02-546 [hydrothermal vent metagenome]|uniref:Sulfatase N-terminal domain-containing protein n=1 Tax=hydrothermal vent metagenome TaxID=652676 RepID=A0A3B0VTF4_9ZZZZ